MVKRCAHLCLLITEAAIRLHVAERVERPTMKKNQPPSPRGLPILGNLHQLGSLPHHPLHSFAKKYGPVVLLQFGRVPTVVISSAEGASQIMKTHDLVFCDRPKSSIAEKLLYNMRDISVAPYGEYWRQLKSICVLQLLSNKKVQAFRSVREEEIALMMEKIKESCFSSSPVNLSGMFMELTNDIVCRSAFGRKYGEGESGKKFRQLLSEFLQLLGSIYMVAFIPVVGWINRFNGFDARVDRVAREIDEFLEKVLQERQNRALETNQEESTEDFLDILLRIYKDNATGLSLDKESIKAVILDVFSAGTDTTAAVAEWIMTELIRNPTIMTKAQNEVRGAVNGKQDITDSDLDKMHYLKAVIKETLRLHPPIPTLVPREAREDVEIMGYHIAAGTMVMVNAWTIGRDPETWDEAEEFKPERFLNSPVDFKGQDFQLIPFGAGRRGCPGTAFAMATNELVIANLVHKFDWKLPNGAKGEDLDMSERAGATIQRKTPLIAVASPVSL